ncbi:MAG TPA: methyltransferase [Candidatus Nanoarchaeia archaeon]|nr:methyltransferase [Candidatus Nanoarchaeia archaeon]
MEHYYSKNPSSELKIKKIQENISGNLFEFYTSSGIFSKDKVDSGTMLLAKSMMVSKNSDVLDIGCGIGILGIAAAKLFRANVQMTDINQRAVMLAKKNIRLNNVDGEIFCGELYEKIKKNDFDCVLSNPPHNAGKEVCFRIIEGAFEHLKKNGTLQLVARRNKGGESLSKKMEEVFGNVTAIAKQSGYWVYLSEKS